MYPPASGQQDTTAIPRPQPAAGAATATQPGPWYGQAGPDQGPGYGPGPAYGPAYGPGYGPAYPTANPAADAWEAKYLSQRTRTRIAVAIAAVASAATLVLGVAVWQINQNPLFSAASQLASGLGQGDLDLEGLVPPANPDEGDTPAAPDATTPDAPGPNGTDVPLSDLPLPDGLKNLASALGITEVGQLLDLAVANGVMTQEDADNLRAAIASGALVQGLAQGQAG